MKQLYSYILLLASLALASCHDGVTDDTEPVTPAAEPASGVLVSVPEFIDGNAANDGAVTRTTLYHDKVTDVMLFSWDNDASMGVFHPNGDKLIPIKFVRENGNVSTDLNSIFNSADDNVKALTEGTTYLAFRPFSNPSQDVEYKKFPVDYTGQSNGKNVKRKYYYTYDSSEADKDTYITSEKEAAQHLGGLDYLVSMPETADDESYVHFRFQRIGVVVNFFIKCPANTETFDGVQLVTIGDTKFTLTGTVDMTTRQLTPVTTSNVVTLKYGDDGLDMNSTDYQDSKGVGYIISYMMLAPVDLTGNTSVNLYLVSHDASNVKKYYKSGDLAKPKLEANMFYRWRSASNVADDPITFTEVTFQEWQKGTEYENNGNGTEDW